MKNGAQMVERQASHLEVRGSNSGPGSNFSLGFKLKRFVDHRFHSRSEEGNVIDFLNRCSFKVYK